MFQVLTPCGLIAGKENVLKKHTYSVFSPEDGGLFIFETLMSPYEST